MTRFILRRLALTIPVLFGILFLVFALARVVPGDPCRAVLGERATDVVCDAFAKRNGLDQPIPVQFAIYLGQVASGDLGNSLKLSRPVGQMLIDRLPTTVELTLLAMFFAVIVGIPLGLWSAVRHNSKADVGTMVFANLGVSIPVFVLGLVLAYIFGVVLKDTPFSLPPSGRLSSGVRVETMAQVWALKGLTGPLKGLLDFLSGIYIPTAIITGQWNAALDAFRHLLLPALALSTIPMAIIARITRASVLDVNNEDYVRTARAKGLKEKRVDARHIMRNAWLPVVTVIGLSVGGLLAGAVLTETVFSWPGVGRYVVDAIGNRDYFIIQSSIMFFAVIFLIVNLLVDLSYAYLNPRIRYS